MMRQPPAPRVLKFKDIADGLSQTILTYERAGLPHHFVAGGELQQPHEPPESRTWGNVGLWAIAGEKMLNHLTPEGDVRLVNGDNMLGAYAFHPSGVHVAMVDGAVRFVADSISEATLLALVSREQGEIVGPEAVR